MKLLKMMSLLLVILTVTSVGQAELVAHWTFDEASGNALDSSGNGYDGTIVGTVTQGQAGRIDGAYLFSGDGWVNFGVDTITTQITNFPFTISYWIQSTEASSTECAVWMGKTGTNGSYLQTGIKEGNAYAVYRNTDFDNSVAWVNDGAIAPEGDGAWHHIVAVYPSTSERHVYVDGVLAASNTNTQSYYTGTNLMTVGSNKRNDGLTDPFDGLIDDVQIYDEVLDDSTILAIYEAGFNDIARDPLPNGDSVDPTVTTTLSWTAPVNYTPEVGYDLILRKATEAVEPNFAATDNVIEIFDATATPGTAVSLDNDATYYWRVDSYEPNGLTNNASDDFLHPGEVWSFTTLPAVPVITVGPSDAAAAAGETAELVLEYTSLSPLASAVWELSPNGSDPNWIAAGGTSVIDESGTPKTVTLTIPGVAIADEGLYRCTVTNDGGATVSETPGRLAVKRQLAYYAFEGNANDTNTGGGITNDGIATVWANETATPDITYAATGLPGLGDGVVFNASTDVVDPNQSYIQLPMTAYPNADVGGGLDAGTITCWIKPKTTGTVIGVFNDGLNTSVQFSVQNTTSLRIFRRNDFHNESNLYFSPPTAPDGETWYFAAVTWGDANGQVRTYIAPATENGYVEDIVNDVPDNYTSWQYAPAIGGANSRGTINSFFMSGSMLDDLKVYNYALSPEDIAAEFNAVTGNTLCIVTSFDGDYFDVNGDCVVDMLDFADFAAAWLATGLY